MNPDKEIYIDPQLFRRCGSTFEGVIAEIIKRFLSGDDCRFCEYQNGTGKCEDSDFEPCVKALIEYFKRMEDE